ncbi:MAG: tyrosine-type recombinase/integrase [Alphaproteobacteria bacterium]|nr:tyrosine-type recombinase/integrase [Alphaproteobacteria bacterium]
MKTRYVQKNGRLYWYIRVVPIHLRELVGKDKIKMSLKTADFNQAVIKADKISGEIEKLWDESLSTDSPMNTGKFNRLVRIAKLYGYRYQPEGELAHEARIHDIIDRIDTAEKEKKTPAEAVLGAEPFSYPPLSKCLEEYWTLSKDEVRGKTAFEIRKWENPRKKAIANLITVCGDKPIDQLKRSDLVAFRQWWMERIEENDLSPNSANKDFTKSKVILCKVSETHFPEMKIRALYEGVKVREQPGKRHPFTTEFIAGTLLNRAKMAGMGEELFLFLHAMVNTGARVKELTGLMKEDIVLDHAVPHIIIRKNEIRSLKTKNSERVIPLVGASLYAFRQLPDGFRQYRGKSDNLSNALNKFMRDHDLYPSNDHSLYSLRHSFQDRLILAEAPERIQADLMGHAISRPRYGDGAGLAQKAEWMEKISIEANNTV